MNKSDLVARVSESVDGGRVAANRAVEAVIDAIQEAVSRGEKVAISGFGVFERVERAARTGRNPATGEPVQVRASAVPKFRPGAEFRGYVSGAREFVNSAARTVQAAAATIAPARKPAGSKTPAAPVKRAGGAAAPAAKAPAKTAAKKAPAAKKATPAKSATKATTAASNSAGRTAQKSTAQKSAAKKAPARKAPAKRSS